MPSFSILSLLTLFSLFSFSCADPKVDISISPSSVARLNDRVRITCFVTGLSSTFFVYKVRLKCPILSESIACFQDCKNTCQDGSGCTTEQANRMAAFNCKSYRGSDKMQFQYDFPYTADAFSGHYMCQFFGKDSARVLLPKPIRPTTTTPSPTKPHKVTKGTLTTVKKPIPPGPKTTPKTGEPVPRACDKGGSCAPPKKPGEPNWREKELLETRASTEVVLAAVVVFFILSLIANTIFCVRCILVNKYAKDPQRLQRMSYCMSCFLCLDPEVYLRKRESSTFPLNVRSASLMTAPLERFDAGGSDSTYSMPASLPVPQTRSQTLPQMMAAPLNDSQHNIVYIPVIAPSVNAMRSGSHPGLNMALADGVSRFGVPAPSGSGGDSGVGASMRYLAQSPPPPVPPVHPVPPVGVDESKAARRLSGSVSRLHGNGRMGGRHLSGDSTREVDEEETLIE